MQKALVNRTAVFTTLLLLMGIYQAQAATLSIDKAAWDANGLTLYVKGYGEAFTTVELFVAGSDYLLDTAMVYSRDRWRMTLYNPAVIPCSVRAENQGISVEAAIDNAPADCVDADSLQDGTTTNNPPVINGAPPTDVTAGEFYSFTPTASDADGDSLSFSISGQPVWANFNSGNGTLSGTPSDADVGFYSNIVISASDGTDSAMLEPFSITVNEAISELTPTAPKLISATVNDASISLAWTQDGAVPEGGYDIIVDGIDTNEQYRTTLLTATIPNVDATVSHCYAIQARYTDTSQFLNSNELCTNPIEPSNTPPSISGSPAPSVIESNLYSFTPTAYDPDGDTLNFSATNLPSWLNLDVNTGTISGIPGIDDVAFYEDIIIHVSDGIDSASTSPFSITVEAAEVATASVNLSWITPTTRTDGSYLDPGEIGGYRVYMSETNDTDSLQMVDDINDGSTNAAINYLEIGVTYYFAVTTYDIDGNEGPYQDTLVSKTMQ